MCWWSSRHENSPYKFLIIIIIIIIIIINHGGEIAQSLWKLIVTNHVSLRKL